MLSDEDLTQSKLPGFALFVWQMICFTPSPHLQNPSSEEAKCSSASLCLPSSTEKRCKAQRQATWMQKVRSVWSSLLWEPEHIEKSLKKAMNMLRLIKSFSFFVSVKYEMTFHWFYSLQHCEHWGDQPGLISYEQQQILFYTICS